MYVCLRVQRQFPEMQFLRIGSAAFGLQDVATGDYDLAVVKKALHCASDEDGVERTSVTDLLREIESGIRRSNEVCEPMKHDDDVCCADRIGSLSVSDVEVVEDAKIPILRMMVASAPSQRKEVEVQAGLRGFEFNLRSRNRRGNGEGAALDKEC